MHQPLMVFKGQTTISITTTAEIGRMIVVEGTTKTNARKMVVTVIMITDVLSVLGETMGFSIAGRGKISIEDPSSMEKGHLAPSLRRRSN